MKKPRPTSEITMTYGEYTRHSETSQAERARLDQQLLEDSRPAPVQEFLKTLAKKIGTMKFEEVRRVYNNETAKPFSYVRCCDGVLAEIERLTKEVKP